jgi:hypothetical protein
MMMLQHGTTTESDVNDERAYSQSGVGHCFLLSQEQLANPPTVITGENQRNLLRGIVTITQYHMPVAMTDFEGEAFAQHVDLADTLRQHSQR